jgi:hypothetical protein
MLTQKLVKERFDYRDGKLYWKIRAANNVFAGDEAGFMQGNGYRGVVIHRKIYPLHRVIFLYHYGFLPKIVDHIDCNIANNSIENLRSATVAANGHNKRVGVNNTSGVKNVSWCKAARKWVVMVQKNGKQHYFGRYENLDDAALVARQARTNLHQTFARHV